MTTCDKVIKVLNFMMHKFVLFPAILIGSPIIFVMAGKDGCAKAKEEIKDILRFAWTGVF